MSDGNIDIKFTVDEAAAFRAWQRQQQAIERMKKKLDELKNKPLNFGTIAGKTLSSLKDAAIQLVGIGSAVGALVTFAQQLIAEIETIKKKQSAAGKAQVGIVPSLDAATQNSGGALTAPQILNMAKKTAAETGQTVSKVLDTFGATWAAGAPESADAAKATAPVVKAVLNTFPTADPETTAQIAGVVQSLMKREGMSEEEAVGFYLKAGEGHRSRKNEALAKHGIPAGVKGTAFDATLAESQATANVFSQSMLDSDGQLSGHASIVFQEQLRERLPDLTYPQRLGYMRAHPEEARAYMEGGTIRGKKFDKAKLGEAASIPTVEGILGLNKAPAFAGLYDEFKKESDRIGKAGSDRKGLSDRNAQQVKANLSTGPQVLAAEERRGASAKELQQLADSEAAAKGIASEGFDATMSASDLSGWEQWFRSQGHFWKGGGANDLAAEMDKLADDQDMSYVNVGSGISDEYGIGGTEFKTIPNPDATNEQKIKGANYRKAAAELRKLETQRKSANQDTTSQEASGTPLVSPQAGSIGDLLGVAISNVSSGIRVAFPNNAPGPSAASPSASMDMLSSQIQNLIEELKNNTAATQQNTKSPATPTGGGPRPSSVGPRNNQASRQLGRGSPLIGGMS